MGDGGGCRIHHAEARARGSPRGTPRPHLPPDHDGKMSPAGTASAGRPPRAAPTRYWETSPMARGCRPPGETPLIKRTPLSPHAGTGYSPRCLSQPFAKAPSRPPQVSPALPSRPRVELCCGGKGLGSLLGSWHLHWGLGVFSGVLGSSLGSWGVHRGPGVFTGVLGFSRGSWGLD